MREGTRTLASSNNKEIFAVGGKQEWLLGIKTWKPAFLPLKRIRLGIKHFKSAFNLLRSMLRVISGSKDK